MLIHIKRWILRFGAPYPPLHDARRPSSLPHGHDKHVRYCSRKGRCYAPARCQTRLAASPTLALRSVPAASPCWHRRLFHAQKLQIHPKHSQWFRFVCRAANYGRTCHTAKCQPLDHSSAAKGCETDSRAVATMPVENNGAVVGSWQPTLQSRPCTCLTDRRQGRPRKQH